MAKSMHYRNGREAQNGDRVVKLSITGGTTAAQADTALTAAQLAAGASKSAS